MHVGIDYTPAVSQRAGIGRFTRGLVQGLAELDRDNVYTLAVCGRGSIVRAWPANFRLRRLPWGERLANILWHRLGLPLAIDLFTGPLDVFHSPNYLLPPLRRGARIITVHDLSFLVVPQCAEPSLARYLSRTLPPSLERATLVLADSQSTKGDLVERLGVPPEKVEVVYGGVGAEFSPVEDQGRLAAVRARYGIEGPFILSLGTLEPRKNLEGLLRAYALLRQEGHFQHRLLIAGARGWLYQRIFAMLSELGVGDSVAFLEFVPEEDLPSLLSLADLFVFPSLYEGFGLPPLEAMACGTPVVASRAPSMPEVLGEAALLVDPNDPWAMAGGIRRGIEDSDLRRTLVARGRVQAAKYTWIESARRLLGLYQRAMDMAGGRNG